MRGTPTSKNFQSDLWKSYKNPYGGWGVRTLLTSYAPGSNLEELRKRTVEDTDSITVIAVWYGAVYDH